MAAPFNLFRSIDPLLASEVVADEVLFTAVHQDSPVLTENCRDSILNELLDAVREQEYLNHSITLFPAVGTYSQVSPHITASKKLCYSTHIITEEELCTADGHHTG